MTKIKQNKYSILCISIALLVFGLWSYIQAGGQEINVCVKKSGLVYVIGESFKATDCKSNDSLLSWNITGPKGDKGDQGIQGEVGPKGDKGDPGVSGTSLHLYDANNQDLGILVSSNKEFTEIQTYIDTLDAMLTFKQTASVNPNSFSVKITGDYGIYFSDVNCTGNSYTRPEEGNMPYSIQKLHGLNRFFKLIGVFPVASVETKSFLGADSGVCTNSGGGGNLIQVEEVTMPFSYPPTGPLHVE